MAIKITPIRDKILIHNIERGLRSLNSGIVLLNDDGQEHGIRSRWAEVYEVGPEINYLKKGQWILVEHGRWSRGIEIEKDFVVYTVDNKCILAVSDEEPDTSTVVASTEQSIKRSRY